MTAEDLLRAVLRRFRGISPVPRRDCSLQCLLLLRNDIGASHPRAVLWADLCGEIWFSLLAGQHLQCDVVVSWLGLLLGGPCCRRSARVCVTVLRAALLERP